MKFSLITATLADKNEIEQLITSLSEQTHKNLELIVVDQGGNDYINSVVDRFASLDIKHIKATSLGLSHARNLGLDRITGQIIAFPDDDCTFPPDILREAADFFEKNPGYGILSVAQADPQTGFRVKQFIDNQSDLMPEKIFRTCTSIGLFIRLKDSPIKFDEQFGVGSRFGCAEETDYVLRLLQKGYKGRYEPNLHTLHLPHNEQTISVDKLRTYSIGLGAFLKKHCVFKKNRRLTSITIQLLFLRPLAGMMLSLLTLRFLHLKHYYTKMTGRIRGFIQYDKECYEKSRSYE